MICISDAEFKQLSAYIKMNFGIRLGQEKKTLVMGRLRSVLAQNHFNSFSEYYEHLVGDKTGNANIALVNAIATNHTFFMREADHFHFFRDYVLPYLVKTVKNRDLRIWSAGCSYGQEPYTLAMIIDEYFGADKKLWDTKILATDLSLKALAIARAGLYTNEELSVLPVHWRTKYFSKSADGRCLIDSRLREEVVFRQFNLVTESYPFKNKFHVIFCRNVMIYFDHSTKDQLANKFYHYTENEGFLFIGHSESLNRESSCYKYVVPAVYRKERLP